MKTLDLDKYKKARIWIGELPSISYKLDKLMTREYPAIASGSIPEIRTAAVELSIATSGYGLLGGTMEPDNSEELKVKVNLSSSNEPVYTDSLVTKGDCVRVGLPAEYVEGVFTGVTTAGESLKLRSGTMTINIAAHGEVRSSNRMYKHISIVLVKLFTICSATASEEQLMHLFPARYE